MTSEYGTVKLRHVHDFHEKFGFPIARSLSMETGVDGSDKLLADLADAAAQTSSAILAQDVMDDDLRIARAQLMIEELSEVIQAMSTRDEVEFADGLADLLYVVIGTAVAFDIPLAQLYEEVHASNMTKDIGGHKPVKGRQFVHPNIARVLKEARNA